MLDPMNYKCCAEYCTFLVENTPKSIKLRVTCTKGTLRELHALLPLLYGLLRTLRHAQCCENHSEFENLGWQISPLPWLCSSKSSLRCVEITLSCFYLDFILIVSKKFRKLNVIKFYLVNIWIKFG